MPLAPEATLVNLERSLTAWIETHLRGTAGLTVFYGAGPVLPRPGTLAAWVHVDYLWGLRSDYGRQVDRTQLGARTHGVLNLSLCQRRTMLATLTDMAALRDRVMGFFEVGQTIPLRNYAVVGTPVIGACLVPARATEPDVDDGLVSGLIVKVLSIPLAYSEAWTLV